MVFRELRFLLDLENLAALVKTAMRADAVRKSHMTAVAALGEVGQFKGVVRPAPVATAFGNFPLGKGCHFYLRLNNP